MQACRAAGGQPRTEVGLGVKPVNDRSERPRAAASTHPNRNQCSDGEGRGEGRGESRPRSAGSARMPQSSSRNLGDEARALVEALGGRWTRRGAMCRCPTHEDSTPSLSVRVGDTALLLKCFSGCETVDILRALRCRGLFDGTVGQRLGEPEITASGGVGWRALAAALWTQSSSIEGTVAERYLASRGLTAARDMRFNARTALGPAPHTVHLPALVIAVRDDAQLVGVHRTFLDPVSGRKAAIVSPKLALGRLDSGAARLFTPAGDTLGLAEGPENALSATMLFGVPVWAALGNERFGRVSIPRHITRLLLFVDNDNGGRIAEAKALAAHTVAGRTIETRMPPHPGRDWNDVLLEKLAGGREAAQA